MLMSGLSQTPPHEVRRDFFSEEIVAGLLEYVKANEPRFEPTRVHRKVDTTARTSKGISDLGPFRVLMETTMREMTGELISSLRVGHFELSTVELNIVAHGEGAFFKPHIDTFTGEMANEQPQQRMISAVYYFCTDPPAFTGGALRLHPLRTGDGAGGFVDIAPERNSLVVFPSWVPHEVLPVSCSSGRFMDSRFAINCWLRRNAPGS
jgi:SM-20-related protein